MVPKAAPRLVQARRAQLSLARALQDTLRGRRCRNPATAHYGERRGPGVPGVPRALSLLGGAVPRFVGALAGRSEAARTLAAEGGCVPVPGALDRGGRRSGSGVASGVGAAQGRRAVYRERHTGCRIRSCRAARRCERGEGSGTLLRAANVFRYRARPCTHSRDGWCSASRACWSAGPSSISGHWSAVLAAHTVRSVPCVADAAFSPSPPNGDARASRFPFYVPRFRTETQEAVMQGVLPSRRRNIA